MKISYENQENVIFVDLSGELDTPAIEEIQPVMDELINLCDHDFVIDCSNLSYIASAGLRQLLTLRKATRANSKKFELKNIQPTVMEVLQVSNFDRIFGLA